MVIGDAIVDEYNYCRVVGTVSKYPVISAIFEDSISMAGGSLAVARHISGFVRETHVVSLVSQSGPLRDLIDHSLDEKGVSSYLFSDQNTSTVLKRRFISRGYPNPLNAGFSGNNGGQVRLLEVGHLAEPALSAELEAQIIKHLHDTLSEFDVVVVADFGHGVLTPAIAQVITDRSPWWSVNAQTNSANFGFNFVTKYSKPEYICVDEVEARLPFGDRSSPLATVAAMLHAVTTCPNVMITRGKEGLSLFQGERCYAAPALATQVVDPVGAGDAVLALSSLYARLEVNPELIAFLSACTGAIATTILGNTESVSRDDLLSFATCAYTKR